jgi:biotin carboxylase
MMKTILIVHTQNASRRKHFAAARRYGARLLLIQSRPTWELEFVDRAIDVDTRDSAQVGEAARRLADSERIDGVITFVEHSVPSASTAAAALGLPFVSERTANLARNKYEMRRAFTALGIPCPSFELARSLDEARALGRAFGYPLVLKPLIGGGSMFIRRVDSEAELETHFATIQKGAWDGFDYDPLYTAAYGTYGGAILIESYVDGGEVSVESLVCGSTTHHLAIHDKPLPMTGPFFEEVYYATPSQLSAQRQDELVYWTEKAHQALGINIGATHTEFRITDGAPVILETAARMGGGPIYRSVLTSTGADMVHAIMDLAVGKQPTLPVRQPHHVGFYMFFAPAEGIIRAIDGVEAAATDPDVVEIDMYRRVGDRVLLPPRVFQCHGHVIVRGASREALEAKVHDLSRQIRLEVIPDAAGQGQEAQKPSAEPALVSRH